MGQVFFITSGKGGVGKTTLTSNIAACLSERGRRVLCLDADLRLRNLDIALNLQDKAIFDIQDIFMGRCAADKATLVHPLHQNLFFIPAPIQISCEIEALYTFLKDFAYESAKEYDFVFIDCPSGVGAAFNGMITKGCEMLIVTTPDLLSIRDAEKTAELGYLKAANARLLVNRIRPILIKKGFAPDIDDIINVSSVRLLGIIPEDGAIIANAGRGILLCDLKRRTRGRRAVENIAARLDGVETDLYIFK